LEATAQDDAVELAEALLTDLFKDAAAANKEKRLRTLRDLDGAAIRILPDDDIGRTNEGA